METSKKPLRFDQVSAVGPTGPFTCDEENPFGVVIQGEHQKPVVSRVKQLHLIGVK